MQPYIPAPIFYFHRQKLIIMFYSNHIKIEEPVAVIFDTKDLIYIPYLWPDRII